MGKTKVVVYWPETEQVSQEDLVIVREEDRYQEARTSIKSGNKYHHAIIKLISSDSLKLREMEDKVAKEIEEAIQKREQEASNSNSGRKTRAQKKSSRVQGTASANQVASALGERLKPTPLQANKAKELADAKRAANKAQQAAQDAVDKSALGDGRKRLFESDSSDGEESSGDDNQKLAEYVSEEEEEPTASSNDNNDACCEHCKSLRKAYTQSGTMLVMALGAFGSLSAKAGVQFAELLPIQDNVPKCELSRGSNVFIKISDKNSIKIDGEGDPSKMTRLAVVALYGRQTLEENSVTALGTKAGTLGIRKDVRDALRGFVNRNKGDGYSALSVAQFNRVINRKKSQMHRKPVQISKTKKAKSPVEKSGTPVKSPISEKFDAVPKEKRTIFKSPVKLQAIASPAKANWTVNNFADTGERAGNSSSLNPVVLNQVSPSEIQSGSRRFPTQASGHDYSNYNHQNQYDYNYYPNYSNYSNYGSEGHTNYGHEHEQEQRTILTLN